MPQTERVVLLLAGQFEVRGSCSYTLRLAEYVRPHGIQTRVVCSNATKVPEDKRKKLSIAEYPYLDSPGIGRLVEHLVCRDFESSPPDLIHVQTLKMLPAGIRLARRLGRPFILTVHDYPPPRPPLRLNSHWWRRMIAVSRPVQAELLKHVSLQDDQITVIHSGVECPEESETQQVLGPDHVPVVGTAGPLEARKGIPFFLGAARKVIQQRRDVEFLVSGAGPEEGSLRRLARELGISHQVTFAPNFFDFSVSLAALDVFCLPSLQQGLGTIMLEAMAIGKPVIASGVGGVYSVVHDNETGLVVPPSDSQALATRILELLDDPTRARSIGEKARQLVREHFSVDEMIQRTVDVYNQVIEAESPPDTTNNKD